MPETKSTDSARHAPVAAVSGSTSATRATETAVLSELASNCATDSRRLVGAEYVVFDDLNNGARKPVQIQFYGTDSRKLMEITNELHGKVRKIPGAVDVGLSEQDPKDELRIELDRGLANQLGISVNDAAQTLRVAFAGVEVGDWVDPIGESRDVAVRLAPEDRARCLQHRASADRRGRHQHDGAARADRDHHASTRVRRASSTSTASARSRWPPTFRAWTPAR